MTFSRIKFTRITESSMTLSRPTFGIAIYELTLSNKVNICRIVYPSKYAMLGVILGNVTMPNGITPLGNYAYWNASRGREGSSMCL
jgi:hypothetical protein